MNRKKLLIFILVIAIGVIAWFFFFKKSPEPTVEIPLGTNPFPTSTTTVPLPQPQEPNFPNQVIPTTTTSVMLEKVCSGSTSIFEKNDCISNLAEKNNNKSFCDYVVGSLAKQECLNNKSSAQLPIASSQSPSQSYTNSVNSYLNKSVSSGVTVSNTVTQSPSSVTPPQAPSNFNVAAFKNGLTFGAPLSVYAASRYEVTPNTSIKIYGSGFTASDNLLNIGNQQTTLTSADGSTLDAVSPGSEGEYEIWVTNSKGSSKVAERPVKITVTNSPRPLPTIESASPSPVSIDGTVTLTGTGFDLTNNIITSMGTLENVSSNGTSISFKVSDLPYSSYSKAVPELKGKIIPVLVNLQTSGGVNEKVFQFNVQF